MPTKAEVFAAYDGDVDAILEAWPNVDPVGYAEWERTALVRLLRSDVGAWQRRQCVRVLREVAGRDKPGAATTLARCERLLRIAEMIESETKRLGRPVSVAEVIERVAA